MDVDGAGTLADQPEQRRRHDLRQIAVGIAGKAAQAAALMLLWAGTAVASGPDRLPDTYCNCSRGWLLEVFENITGKPASVELLSSIRRGGADCRFVVRLGA